MRGNNHYYTVTFNNRYGGSYKRKASSLREAKGLMDHDVSQNAYFGFCPTTTVITDDATGKSQSFRFKEGK